jgi:sugar fermentation stimulation protein A
VNTHRSNLLVWEVWEERRNPAWLEYTEGFREVKINSETRLDFKWTAKSRPDHYVEVKNVTLKAGECAQFPDAVTTRGQKHLQVLMDLVKKGATAEIVFTVQREDCTAFSPADDIDPDYGKLLRKAATSGVQISVWPTTITSQAVWIEPSKAIVYPSAKR